MSKRKTLFKSGKGSWLERGPFKELQRTVRKRVWQIIQGTRHPRWSHIKEAALQAIADWADKYDGLAVRNAEGGHVCLYSKRSPDVPAFALRIASYSRHRVEDLHKGKALYRGLVDIVPAIPPKGVEMEPWEMIKRENAPPTVLYLPLARLRDGKWRKKLDFDLIDVVGVVKEHPGSSGTDIQHTLNVSPNKLWRLLDLLRRQRILNHRGRSTVSRWYLNHEMRSDSSSDSRSDSGSDSGSNSGSKSDDE